MYIRTISGLATVTLICLAFEAVGCSSEPPAAGSGDDAGNVNDPGPVVPGVIWHGESGPMALQVDATNIYWGTCPSGDCYYDMDGSEGVWQASKNDGQSVVHLATGANVTELAQFGDELLYTNLMPTSGYRISKQDGTPTNIPERQPISLVSDGQHAYFAGYSCNGIHAYAPGSSTSTIVLATNDCARSLAVDGAYVYYHTESASTPNTSTIVRVSKGGGSPEILGQVQGTVSEIAVNSEYVMMTVWNSDLSQNLTRLSLADHSLKIVAEYEKATYLDLAAVGGTVCLVHTVDQKISLSRIDAGQLVAISDLPKELGYVMALTSDGSDLYWSAAADVIYGGSGYYIGKTAL